MNGTPTIPGTFYGCTNLNKDIYVHSDQIISWNMVFLSCDKLASRNIHIPKTVPLSTSNTYYNGLVNNISGVNWTGRVFNDL